MPADGVRISDAERELLFERLSEHAAAGRIDLAELERRVERVTAAHTREEAQAVLADLPAPAADAAAAPPARRGRGHGEATAPAVDWQPTGERFRDPRTGRVMRVWEDAGGARHYVPDDPPA